MDLNQMTDAQLHDSTVKTAEEQREITLSLLKHLNEVEFRHLYSQYDSPNLHAYCVKELKMSDGEAGRRVGAARLLKEVPLVEEKILKGVVTLTSISQASVFFRREARCGHRFSKDQKQQVVLDLESKSTREVQKLLISKSSHPEIHFEERATPKTESITEMKLFFDEETMELVHRLKEVWSHANPRASCSDILKRALKEAVEKHDPIKKAERSKQRATIPTPAPTEHRVERESKAKIKRDVWLRDGAQCTYLDPRTNQRCEARRFIEEDHIVPKAMGGGYTLENIRLRCRAHNQQHAINTYGWEKMRTYFKSES